MAFKPTEKQEELIKKVINKNVRNMLVVGGSRSGKSFALAVIVFIRAIKYSNSTHIVCRRTKQACVKTLFKTTFPDVVKKCFKEISHKIEFKLSDKEIHIHTGNGNISKIIFAGLGNGDQRESILGLECCTLWNNEVSEMSYDDILFTRSRLAQKTYDNLGNEAKLLYLEDLNPVTKSHYTYKLYIEGKLPNNQEIDKETRMSFDHIFINPKDNISNIGQGYIDGFKTATSANRKRFEEGMYISESENALWKQYEIDNTRISINDLNKSAFSKRMDRIIVSVDPAVTSNKGSDATGISVVGCKYNKEIKETEFFIIDDLTPKENVDSSIWGKIAVDAYKKYGASYLICESNQGGDLLKTVINRIDRSVKYEPVHAIKGKMLRAEPIHLLFHNSLCSVLGVLPELELEMVSYEGKAGDKSPNRLDAMVHGIQFLINKSKFSGEIKATLISPNRKF